MSDKYISAEALTLSLRDDYELNAASFARVKRHIEAAPDMVKRGVWIQNGELDEDGNGQYHCSVCFAGELHNPIVDVPYCWKCGADMRGVEDGK